MLVLPDLLVRLLVEVRGGDEHPELAVTEPRDQSAHLSDTHSLVKRIALRFERELDGDPIRGGTQQVDAGRIPAPVSPWACQVDLARRRGNEPPDLDSACLEARGLLEFRREVAMDRRNDVTTLTARRELIGSGPRVDPFADQDVIDTGLRPPAP
jgi:hypothetical protein